MSIRNFTGKLCHVTTFVKAILFNGFRANTVELRTFILHVAHIPKNTCAPFTLSGGYFPIFKSKRKLPLKEPPYIVDNDSLPPFQITRRGPSHPFLNRESTIEVIKCPIRPFGKLPIRPINRYLNLPPVALLPPKFGTKEPIKTHIVHVFKNFR